MPRFYALRNAYEILVRKIKRKSPRGRPRHLGVCALEDGSNVTGVDWIHVAADRTNWRALVGMIMDCRLWHTSGTGSESSASREDANFTYQLGMNRKGRKVHSR